MYERDGDHELTETYTFTYDTKDSETGVHEWDYDGDGIPDWRETEVITYEYDENDRLLLREVTTQNGDFSVLPVRLLG